MRVIISLTVVLSAAGVVTACSDNQSNRPATPTEVRTAQLAASGAMVVDVGNDTTSQNETPIAVNPANSRNIIVGAND